MKTTILTLALLVITLTSCSTKEREAELIDSYNTRVLVEGVPRNVKSGDTINVLHLRIKGFLSEDGYPYLYLSEEEKESRHYQAIVK